MDQSQRAQIDQLLFQVLRSILHYERSIARSYGLDFEQIYALQFLRRHPSARLTDIAAEMNLPKFAASRLLNRLAQEGWVSKTQSPADRRNYHLHLQDKGEQVLQSIETASYQRISSNIQGFSEDEIHELYDVADHLHIVLGVTDQVKTE